MSTTSSQESVTTIVITASSISTPATSSSLSTLSNTEMPSPSFMARHEMEPKSETNEGSLLPSLLKPLDGVFSEDALDSHTSHFDGDEDDGNTKEEEDDDYDNCDEEDEFADYEDASNWQRRDDDEQKSCWSALEEVLVQLDEIKTMLEMPRTTPIATKRELADFTDEHDEGLTSEQKAALYTLVKGVDGYQTSIEGATDVDQTEQETSQETPMQTSNSTDSTSSLSSWSPEAVSGLLALLDTLLIVDKEEKPSGNTVGSQAGQTVSQIGYTVPMQVAGNEQKDTASTSISNAKSTFSQMQALQSQR